MQHIFKPIVHGGHNLELDYTYDILNLRFSNTYIKIYEEKLMNVENMWGDCIPRMNTINCYEDLTITMGEEDIKEQQLNNFLDVTVTANIHPIELSIIQDVFKDQNRFYLSWGRYDETKDPKTKSPTLSYTTSQARIAKLEILSTGQEIVKVRLRLISPSCKITGKLTSEQLSYYKSLWKNLYDNRFDFVIKTYLIYILLHRGDNITDSELLSISQSFVSMGLFKSVNHTNNPKEILITLADNNSNTYIFKYPEA